MAAKALLMLVLHLLAADGAPAANDRGPRSRDILTFVSCQYGGKQCCDTARLRCNEARESVFQENVAIEPCGIVH